MSKIVEAVEKFRNEQLKVYQIQADRFERDLNAVNETVKDHIGRWPLELIQNCDDAEAGEILIRLTNDAVYIADSGKGLQPDAVKSLSGTHLSVKSPEAIGRKGLGFKAVYEITSSPMIFSGDDDGVVFSPEKARAELRKRLKDVDEIPAISTTTRVPHEWLPFWISRRESSENDAELAELKNWQTVVRLPLDKQAVKLEDAFDVLRRLPSYILLTFMHVRRLEITGNGLGRLIERKPREKAEDIWTVIDSGSGLPVNWRVRRMTAKVPEELLQDLEQSDRERMREVTLLVAAPMDEDFETVVPTNDYPKICVYYPIGEDEKSGQAPVRLLLHGDFLVSSDRKKVLPFKEYPLNGWIADRLVEEVVTFVDDSYRPNRPAVNLRLLLPLRREELEAHQLAESVWERIKEVAKRRLRLPDAKGMRRLTVSEARFMATSVDRDNARRILEENCQATCLMHPSVEQDQEARRVVKVLGCTGFKDEDLLKCIRCAAVTDSAYPEWLWTCWRWLAEWLQDKPQYSEEHRERNAEIKSLPIVPIDGKNLPCSALENSTILTWREGQHKVGQPDWLPLRFVDDWFRDRLLGLEEKHPVRILAEKLGLKEPDESTELQAFCLAVEQYWKEPTGDPSRFARFLLSREFHNDFPQDESAQRCPICVDMEGGPSSEWREADEAYFGEAWGESLMSELYRGTKGTAWVRCDEGDTESYREILEWLGVVAFPRVVTDSRTEIAKQERQRVAPLVGSGRLQRVDCLMLDSINPAELSSDQGTALLRLLARHWDSYYGRNKETSIVHVPPHCRSPQSFSCDANWWHSVKSLLIPVQDNNHAARTVLKKCWLPDQETRQEIGDLLPIIELNKFVDDRPVVESWLRHTVGLRTNLNQISPHEWKQLFRELVPSIIKANGEEEKKIQQNVQRWYEVALSSLEAQQSTSSLADVPLLCRKGEHWEFKNAAAERWLEDRTDLADAFREVLWMIQIKGSLHKQALNYYGLKSLAESVTETACYDVNNAQQDSLLQQKVNAIKPFIFAWRCYKTKQNREDFRQRLLRLKVFILPNIQVEVSLSGYSSRTLSRKFHSEGDRLLLQENGKNVVNLGRALAAALRLRKSEANFFENLLRCSDDAERKEKLKAEDIPEEQIEQLFNEYVHGPAASLPKGTSHVATRNETKIEEEVRKEDEIRESVRTNGEGKMTSGDDDVSPAAPQAEETVVREQLHTQSSPISGEGRLKDGAVASYVVKAENLPEPPIQAVPGTGGHVHPAREVCSSDGESDASDRLTQQEKYEIEAESRKIARRELEQRGYTVESMPLDNKGFDLRAIRQAQVLLVEVKGHRRASYIIEVTYEQVQAHDRYLASGGMKRWQLWNVEHLALSDPNEVTITVVRRIPHEARRADRYRIDLRNCDCETS